MKELTVGYQLPRCTQTPQSVLSNTAHASAPCRAAGMHSVVLLKSLAEGCHTQRACACCTRLICAAWHFQPDCTRPGWHKYVAWEALVFQLLLRVGVLRAMEMSNWAASAQGISWMLLDDLRAGVDLLAATVGLCVEAASSVRGDAVGMHLAAGGSISEQAVPTLTQMHTGGCLPGAFAWPCLSHGASKLEAVYSAVVLCTSRAPAVFGFLYWSYTTCSQWCGYRSYCPQGHVQWATQQQPLLPASYQLSVDEQQFCQVQIVTYGLKQACGSRRFSNPPLGRRFLLRGCVLSVVTSE